MWHQLGPLSGAFWPPKASFWATLHCSGRNLVSLEPQTEVPIPFFLLWIPSPMIAVPGFISKFFRQPPLWGPHHCLSRSCRHVLAEKSRFLGDLRQSPGTLGLLLGDHLMTMDLHIINPWGAVISVLHLCILFKRSLVLCSCPPTCQRGFASSSSECRLHETSSFKMGRGKFIPRMWGGVQVGLGGGGSRAPLFMSQNAPHDSLIILRHVSWGRFFFCFPKRCLVDGRLGQGSGSS